MIDAADIFFIKADECLAGAESEYVNGRYNNCANRCYYACFQAAIAALMQAGIQPTGRSGSWGHDFVQAQFNGVLINRRKRYPSGIRDALRQTYALRETADYELDHVSEVRAVRALRKAAELVEAIRRGGDSG